MSVVNPLQKSQGNKNKSQINKKKKTKKVSKKKKKDPGHEYEGKQLSQNVHYKPINLSTILAVLPRFRKMATPRAWDEKELKMHCPSHSFLIVLSIDLQILVSQVRIKSGFDLFK